MRQRKAIAVPGAEQDQARKRTGLGGGRGGRGWMQLQKRATGETWGLEVGTRDCGAHSAGV